MNHRDFLLKLRRNRIALAIIAVAAFAAGAAFNYWGMEHGKASIAFKIYGSPVVYSTDNDAVYQNMLRSSETYEKQRLMIFSDEMLEYLIEEFDLYTYYKVDRNARHAFAKIRRKVSERIKYDKMVMDVIVLSYIDRDGEVSVNVLNALVEKLDQMNRAELNSILETNAIVHERAINGFKSLSRFSELESNPHRSAEQSREMLGLQAAAYEQSGRVANLTTQLQQTEESRERIITETKHRLRPIVNVVSRPAPESISLMEILGFGVVALVVALLGVILWLYYGEQYAWELKTLFG
jgi:hypothetical protein